MLAAGDRMEPAHYPRSPSPKTVTPVSYPHRRQGLAVLLRSDKAWRNEVFSVIVVTDRTSRHIPLSHQRYPTKMCRKVTICIAPSDNVPTVTRLASKP